MNGENGYVAKCNSQYKRLKRGGLTPLDLYSFETLTLLEQLTRSARRVGERKGNKKAFRAFRNQIFQTLKRKAENVEATTGDTEALEWLEELKRGIKATR